MSPVFFVFAVSCAKGENTGAERRKRKEPPDIVLAALFKQTMLSNKLYQLYLYLVYHDFATLTDLCDIFCVSRKTIMRWINKLRRSELVAIRRTNRGYVVDGYREWDERLIAQAPDEVTRHKAMKEEFYRWKEEMERKGVRLSGEDVVKRFGVTEKTARKWLTTEKSHFATLNGSHAANVRRATASRGLERKGREKSHSTLVFDVKEKSHAGKSPMRAMGQAGREKSHTGKSPIQTGCHEHVPSKASVQSVQAPSDCDKPCQCEQSHAREKSHREPIYQISLYREYITPAGVPDGTFPEMEEYGKTFPVQEEIPNPQMTYRNSGARKAARWVRENVDAIRFVQWMGVTMYRPRGNSHEWAGHCPLHDDRTPSFYVNEENGFWYCHACGIGGDLVELVRRKYGLRFGEAVRWVLSRLSSSPITTFGQEAEAAEKQQPSAEEHESGREVPIMGEEKGTPDMESVKLNAATYLVKRRGIHPDTIKEYRLGVTESEEIAIPLMDRNSQRTGTLYRAIGVGTGRYRQEGNAVLFGVPQALRRMRETGQDTLYVVEGPFDAMSIHQEGFPAVAIMGSALSARQVEEIRKAFGQVRIVLIPDNDQTGWKAVGQNRKMLQKAGFAVKVSRLPHGKDANEYLAEKFRRRYLSNPCADNTENTENNTA